MSWGKEIDTWASRLVKAWETGDMQRYRELAGRLDGVFSDAAIDAHAGELFDQMGRALVAGIDGTVKALAQIDLGFGPDDTSALDFVKGRKEVASTLDSAAWRGVPYQLRDRAFFSAKVNDLKTLQEMKTRVQAGLSWKPGEDNGPVMDAGRFSKEMRAILINGGVRTAAPEELGTLRDILATQRTALVFKTQTDMARGWASLKTGMDPDILDAVPAYEFTRIVPRRNPRPSSFWDARWATAVAQVNGEGCMVSPKVALKPSPVWQALGDLGPFGNPFDPFDFGTGMGREDRDRDYCETVGLLERNQPVEPGKVPDLTERMEEGVADLDPSLISRLLGWFGDQVKIEGEKAVWIG
jgi:hypothetical protein